MGSTSNESTDATAAAAELNEAVQENLEAVLTPESAPEVEVAKEEEKAEEPVSECACCNASDSEADCPPACVSNENPKDKPSRLADSLRKASENK